MLDEILTPASTLERVPPGRLPERMDRRDCDPDRLRDALTILSRANRRFGARRATVDPALGLLDRRSTGRLRILDVGTGSGDIGVSLVRRLRSDGRPARATLTDLHPTTLRIARERVRCADDVRTDSAGRPAERAAAPGAGTEFVRLTASSLPFRDGSFDVAVSASTLHHLERDEARAFLRELQRVSGERWVVTDLRRSRTAYLAVRLLAATVWRRHPYPRRDGPVSVRRAFTAGEVRDLLDEAGLADAAVERVAPFRLRILGRAA